MAQPDFNLLSKGPGSKAEQLMSSSQADCASELIVDVLSFFRVDSVRSKVLQIHFVVRGKDVTNREKSLSLRVA